MNIFEKKQIKARQLAIEHLGIEHPAHPDMTPGDYDFYVDALQIEGKIGQSTRNAYYDIVGDYRWTKFMIEEYVVKSKSGRS